MLRVPPSQILERAVPAWGGQAAAPPAVAQGLRFLRESEVQGSLRRGSRVYLFSSWERKRGDLRSPAQSHT